jgi:exodeoxyribonuclease V alpha subunit
MPAITRQTVTLIGELTDYKVLADDGWGRGTIDTGTERVDVKGKLVGVRAGSSVELQGEWEDHPRYGRQLKVSACTITVPNSVEGVVAWLASTLPGVGRARALELVERFGAEPLGPAGLWDVIEHRPDELLQVSGITPARVAKIREAYLANKADRDDMVMLRDWGLTDSQVAHCVKEWKTLKAVVARVRENPYQLSQHVFGFGFLRADKIAMRAGVTYDSPLRVAAALEHVLNEECERGHVFLSSGYLVVKTIKLLGVGEELVVNAVGSAIRAGRVVRRGTRIYPKRLDQAEHVVAEGLVRLLQRRAA